MRPYLGERGVMGTLPEGVQLHTDKGRLPRRLLVSRWLRRRCHGGARGDVPGITTALDCSRRCDTAPAPID
jgi:hypothetical protein